MYRNLRKPRENIYQKERLEYIQGQINKIRNLVEEKESRLAWQTINEVSGRKNISRSKLKAVRQEEWLQKWKEHFKNMLGDIPEITDKPTETMIKSQEDIRLRQFTKEEPYALPKKN